MPQGDAPLSVIHILHLRHVEVLEQRRIQACLEITARDGDPENNRRDRLAYRLHAMQVGSVIVGVPRRIEIVVRTCEMRVQRPARLRLFPVDLSVIVGVSALVDGRPAAEHGKAVHQRVFATRQITVQLRENLFVEPYAGGLTLRPAMGRPLRHA